MDMKVMDHGFGIFITHTLPGIILSSAALLFHGIQLDQLIYLLTHAKDAEFLATIVLITLFTIAGALVASLHGLMEAKILDVKTARSIGVSDDTYREQWDYYIDNLDEFKNGYVDRLVLFFQFETRMGLAAFLLSVSLAKYSCLHAFYVLILSLFLYWMGSLHHQALAGFRKRNYERIYPFVCAER